MVGVLFAILACGLAACGGSSSGGFKLPSTSDGCGGATSAGGAAMQIPAAVSTASDGGVAAIVNVCFNGKGPYPFIVDTGAQTSTMVTSLAEKLHLPKVGKAEKIAGAGCTATAQERQVNAWSVAGLPLKGQTITATDLPEMGGKGEPDGVIGSEVWAGFGGMRLDFKKSQLIVPGPEQGPPAKEILVNKPATTPLPAALVKGTPQIVAPMHVDDSRQGVGILIRVKLAKAGGDFTPDTGASVSAIDGGVAAKNGLARLSSTSQQSTVCTTLNAHEVKSGPWSLAGKPLTPQTLVTVKLLLLTGNSGLLGADQMSRFGSVVFDYRGGRLVLGAG